VGKFKVGDRVSFHEAARSSASVQTLKGEIIAIWQGNECCRDFGSPKPTDVCYQIRLDNNAGLRYAHPKQCRLLKKKEKFRTVLYVPSSLDYFVFPATEHDLRNSVNDVVDRVNFLLDCERKRSGGEK
jgi:hypothetical protein